jgi:hypothetical protein
MLACQHNFVVGVMLENVNGVKNFFRYTNDWRNGSRINNDLRNYHPNRCAMLDEIIVAVARPQSKKIVFQLFGGFAEKLNVFITNQRANELVNCIGDQCFTFLVSNVDEVVVTIQLGSHVKKFELTQMKYKCNEAKM